MKYDQAMLNLAQAHEQIRTLIKNEQGLQKKIDAQSQELEDSKM